MRYIGLLLFVLVLQSSLVIAQTPNQFKYQAVLRNADGTIMTEENVTVIVSILKSDLTTRVFNETHSTSTNTLGLINLNIGSKEDLSGIDWSADEYFIEISVNGTVIGTSQLLSVPYSLHAKTAENFTGTITESDPVYLASEAANITSGDITNLSYLSGTNTGDQDLTNLATQSALEDTAYDIRNDIPDVNGFITSESDPVYSAWNKSYNDLTNTPDIIDSLNTVMDTTTQFIRTEVDGSITNEIQTINKTGNTVTLSKGGGSFTDDTATYIAGSGLVLNDNEFSIDSSIEINIAPFNAFEPSTSGSVLFKAYGFLGISSSGSSIILIPLDIPNILNGVTKKLKSITVLYRCNTPANGYISASRILDGSINGVTNILEDATIRNNSSNTAYTLSLATPTVINNNLFLEIQITNLSSTASIYLGTIQVELTN